MNKNTPEQNRAVIDLLLSNTKDIGVLLDTKSADLREANQDNYYLTSKVSMLARLLKDEKDLVKKLKQCNHELNHRVWEMAEEHKDGQSYLEKNVEHLASERDYWRKKACDLQSK